MRVKVEGLADGRARANGREAAAQPSGATPVRADVEALLAGGWPRVTSAQLAILDRIADRHGGPEWAADVISGCGPGLDYLAAVKAADERWRTDRLAEAKEAERRAEATKAEEREAADRLFRQRALEAGARDVG